MLQQLQAQSGDGQQRADIVMQHAGGAAQFGVERNAFPRQFVGGGVFGMASLDRV